MAAANSYEEARKQRMKENLRKFQDLGVAKIAKSLTDQTTKPKPKAIAKPRTPVSVDPDLVRRSSRPHNTVTSYAEEFIEDRPMRKICGKSRDQASQQVKKPNEKVATEAQRAKAMKHAEDYQGRYVPSTHPSYVKSMLQSHVYNGFWLKYLPGEKTIVVLEDARAAEFDVVYTGEKENAGLSGGWKAFAEAHKLDVYIFKGIGAGEEGNNKKQRKAKGGKGKKSDAKEDMVEGAAEKTAQPRERKTRNSKKAGE
ncbi:hypothetical protein MKW98_019787 [Papaver atlanticum]|uniref:TF-B3 domain-containing protein n=1 Tax=Papaver atlanticum TaxID=357466 RepID=A0AAD4TCX2_9MAGN|nr:hypothetical protein MKW98_019787 [Papaver atlanticum]